MLVPNKAAGSIQLDAKDNDKKKSYHNFYILVLVGERKWTDRPNCLHLGTANQRNDRESDLS